MVGALTYVTVPARQRRLAQFTALPIQIFNWVSRPQQAFLVNAAAGIVVLLAMMLVLNAARHHASATACRARLARAH